jgi:LysM repeat protein
MKKSQGVRIGVRSAVMAAVLVLLMAGSSLAYAAPPPAPTGATCSATYVVRWGDNLTHIAAWHGTTVGALATLNGIANPNRIYAGQALCVRTAPSTPQGTTYTVRWGDTLTSIAWRFGVRLWDLAAANGLSNPNWIYAGQVLWVPTGGQPGTIDRVKIYLIAVGDNGQSGQKIGCDDSVVPVEVAVAPTRAPLRASLDKLLSIEDQHYGESGLYNALYQSNLWITEATILNRHATVRLAGTEMVGGTCDVPRVSAQLQATALQFSTVDSVSIYVNGTLLEDVLD